MSLASAAIICALHKHKLGSGSDRLDIYLFFRFALVDSSAKSYCRSIGMLSDPVDVGQDSHVELETEAYLREAPQKRSKL